MTRNPFARSWLAVSRPKPRFAPVTSAVGRSNSAVPMTSGTSGAVHLRLRYPMAVVMSSWRCVPRLGDESRQVEMNRGTIGSRPLRTWLDGTAAAEPTPSPEKDEGDGGDDDRK